MSYRSAIHGDKGSVSPSDSRRLNRCGNAGFVIVLLASTFLLGSSFIAGKILLVSGIPLFLLVGWRFIVAALATLPLVLLNGESLRDALFPKTMRLRDVLIVIVIGLTQTTGVMGLLFLAMRTISASTAAILIFSNPIWVAIFGWIFLREPLHRARITGLVMGITGVAFALGLGSDALSGGTTRRGEFIGFAASLCWTAATIINKRAHLPLGPWALSFWQMLVGSLTMLVLAYSMGERWPTTTTPVQWGWFIWLAIPASTGSFGLWFVALAKGGATKASGYLFLVPLFAVLLSHTILGATLSWLQALGGFLIGLALWLVNREIPARNQSERLNEAIAEGQP